MENPRMLLARSLPHLIKIGGTTEPSVSGERLCASYMHLWPDFLAQVRAACNSLSFTSDISLTDSPEGDFYFVGSGVGLTTRFTRHISDPVAKALSVSNLPLKFGDIQAIKETPIVIPDITLAIFDTGVPLSSHTATLIAAGELKTWWTVDLEEFTVRSDLETRTYLEPYIGQVVSYMRRFHLRYGFLSTYKSTVFVKREDDFCFHLSMPINKESTNPSLRECFAGFAAIAAQNPDYEEVEQVDTRLLRSSRAPGVVSSFRTSGYRSRFSDPTNPLVSINNITTESIVIGSNGVATCLVECIELLSSPRLGHKKAVFEVEYGGMRYIAKCWSRDQDESAANEFAVYERLHQRQPTGSEFFTRLVFSGEIICSTHFPEGRILLLEKVPGKQLFGIWNTLSFAEKAHIYSQCSSAIQMLRSISIRLVDSGKHNVLYDRQSGKVTLVDFEAVVDLSGQAWTSLKPELPSIFGVSGMSEFIHGG
ncbi:hypothetical protein N7462_011487 [Penicillium macrosclerotiorum]|uniref:uncharacterized protein n=1 Tax=Penicillium macrosclerotiorum TaxID=303699 RepID=UPI002547839F|nr:uncharacterized protein N7462_011487 [Penicillium macrosclerotiorum]KAJ5664674.1 hypothetical protein N7462_011487 [Penicillium macrosclerotiorum]